MPELRVPAIEFYQKQVRMCLFVLGGSSLERLFYKRPRTSEDKEGIQRELEPKRLREIAEYIMTSGNLLPNSIVVNLADTVRFEPSSVPQVGQLVFPDSEGQFGILLDGQHRLFGVVDPTSTERDLPLAVTGLFLTDMSTAARVFVGINDNQKPVKKNLLIALQHELGLLPTAEETAAAIVERLNENDDSPLRNRIQMYPNEVGKPLRNDQLVNILARNLLKTNDVLHHYSVDTASTMLKIYLSAIAELFPKAWADHKKFYLVRPAGMEVILPLFQIARERTKALMPSKEQYIAALEPIRNSPWDSKTFRDNRYTSAAGRKDLRESLANKLRV